MLAVMTAPAFGDVPRLLNYQGRFTDPSGNPFNLRNPCVFLLIPSSGRESDQ